MADFFGKFFELNFLEMNELKAVLMLTVGFTLASVLGYCTLKLKISPLLGYLVAGYLIGPYSPGFVADIQLSEQLAEIGVILMMFNIGLNFNLHDLVKVKRIAIPGAICQTFASAICSAVIVYLLGWSLMTGIIVGLAIGVASTVVLVRVLDDNNLLKTKEGHIAVGWLIVEDLITVAILILLPSINSFTHLGSIDWSELLLVIVLLCVKFSVLIVLMLTLGRRLINFVLKKIVDIQSHELFTLSILALTFLVAIGSTFLFGISIALGAFIAGMVIGKTQVKDRAAIHAMPMRDAFIALFFISVGMLFKPTAIAAHLFPFLTLLAIIVFLKPLVAFLITVGMKYSYRVAILVSAALAQIGEFSFILSEEAIKYHLLPNSAYDLIVGSACLSIALNPLIFKFLLRSLRRKSGKIS